MGVFEEVKFSWKGQEYVIPPDRVMGAIAVAENHITLKEITEQINTGNAKIAQIVLAYTRVLRYAGCEVDKDDVYAEMFGQSEANNSFKEQAALTFLLGLMLPPATLRKALDAGAKVLKDAKGKPEKKSKPTVGVAKQ